ncbi:MAG TPA: hypothetical protein VGT00_15530 [Methylomirabilota bacterium]|jgi:hypothetical protein|nr:hypothetical protein [Methylomirabilota bacterium]
MDGQVGGLGLSSIQEINHLPREMAEALYLRLVPEVLLERFRIDPRTLMGSEGTRLVHITAPEDKPWARVEVRSSTRDRDPALLVDVETSPLSVPELAFVQITDPAAARYGIDRDHDGRDTLFGTLSRNVDEELRAFKDGLAPGQVRRGLRLLPGVLDAMEGFCRLIGAEVFLIEPLFYHSAVLYERHGCGYLLGHEVMDNLHGEFSEGGRLAAGLDGSSPFRAPEAGRTVRGRSWALHDGISSGAWAGVKMYKPAGRRAEVNTFPGGIY